VAVGQEHALDHGLFLHLDHMKQSRPAGLLVPVHQVAHPGKGDRIADHRGLGHAGPDGHGMIGPPRRIGFVIILKNRVGVSRLDPENPGQALDDSQAVQFQEAAHDRRDIARVADGHEHRLVRHVPAVVLGHLKGVGLLAQDAPGVLGIEQCHPVVLGQMLHHLHAVVEHPGQFQDHGPAAQGLGQLLRRDLALGQQHHALHGPAHIGRVQGRAAAAEVSPVEAQTVST